MADSAAEVVDSSSLQFLTAAALAGRKEGGGEGGEGAGEGREERGAAAGGCCDGASATLSRAQQGEEEEKNFEDLFTLLLLPRSSSTTAVLCSWLVMPVQCFSRCVPFVCRQAPAVDALVNGSDKIQQFMTQTVQKTFFPQVQSLDKVLVVPVKVQRLVLWSSQCEQSQFIDKVFAVPVVVQRHTMVFLTTQKSVVHPLLQFIDKVFVVPVVVQRQIPVAISCCFPEMAALVADVGSGMVMVGFAGFMQFALCLLWLSSGPRCSASCSVWTRRTVML